MGVAEQHLHEWATPGLHDLIVQCLLQEERGRLLDLGAGEGHLSAKLKAMGFEVYATEYRREFFRAEGIPVYELDHDRDKLPFEDDFFDYVVLAELLEHLKNPWFLMAEVRRVMRPGGTLFLSTPYIHSLRSKVRFVLRDEFCGFPADCPRDGPPGHIHPLSRNELRILLRENGFQTVEIKYQFWKPRRAIAQCLYLALRLWNRDLAERQFAQSIILKARLAK